MKKGRIININSSLYLVESDVKYTCTLRGIFRKDKITPLVGDYVEFDENDKRITKILERKNYLLRPNISNVDIALIVTSVKKPDLDLVLLDKLLVHVITSNITPLIVFTKADLLTEDEKENIEIIKQYYESIGVISIYNYEISSFKKIVKDKVIVCAGQTGAGKSSLINRIDPSFDLETKPISESLNRGVHTTRYVSLYNIDDFYIADTPGFSALELNNISDEDIRHAFYEFNNYSCKYSDCSHINTDGCNVFDKVGNEILKSRYDNYVKFIKEKNESSSKFSKRA